MKKLALILLMAIVFGCGRETAERPENLLDEKEMVNILYDLSLLQAIKSHKPNLLIDNNVSAKNYIYKKYDIDSVSFAQNHAYYASDLEKYEKIQKQVSERIKIEREKFGPSKASKVKETPAALKAKRDSLQRAALNKRARLQNDNPEPR